MGESDKIGETFQIPNMTGKSPKHGVSERSESIQLNGEFSNKPRWYHDT